jgi:molybdopterin/thiamine biosynthesis adenylyltransferase
MTDGVTLSHEEILRYSRHLLIPEVGLEGQKKLKAAAVLVVGTGGLGSPVAMYLAAAGVGRIGLVDYDTVDESNLQRQVIHGASRVGDLKVESARDRMLDINPDIRVVGVEPYLGHAIQGGDFLILKFLCRGDGGRDGSHCRSGNDCGRLGWNQQS